MKFLALILALSISSVAYADNVIVGAFGQKLGATIGENIHKFDSGYTMEDASQAPAYKFFPKKT